MGQGTWGMDPGDDGAEEDYRQHKRELKEKKRAFDAAVRKEVYRQLKGAIKREEARRGKMVERVCECGCGAEFKAREADVKRGWGRFSSKSCAARFKDKSTGGMNREYYGS